LFQKANQHGFLILLGAGGLAMALVHWVDFEWTVFIHAHGWKAFYKAMDRTLFEGEGLGGGDPVMLFLLVIVGCYYLAWKKTQMIKLYRWRPQMGFILTCALTNSFMLVHSLKWVMGRARPKLVIHGDLPFTAWFEFGPHFITEGIYRGSFPSGHTAQAFVLMSLAYILVAEPSHSMRVRISGWCWGFLALVYALTMGIGRCMAYSHWVSDVLGGIVFSWVLTHIIYHRLLFIPQQSGYYRDHGSHPELPQVWELVLCLYLFGAVLGGMAVMIGVRSIFLEVPVALILLIPAGLLLGWFAGRRMIQLRKRAIALFDNSVSRNRIL
jgi:membrane-associated phospholipid phosphatase